MMIRLPLFRYVFTCRWWLFLLAFLLIGLLTALGFWQLHRYEEKKTMLNAHQKAAMMAETVFNGAQPWPTPYQNIRIDGRALQDIILLDNQHHQHQFGYHVLTPVLINKKVLIVDRGFVAGDISRRSYPVIPPIEKKIQWRGYAWYSSNGGLLLGQAWEKLSTNTYLIEQPRTKYFEEILQKNVYPFIMRMSPQADNGFVRQWPIVSMPPDRHKAYALQWFALALTVFLLLLALNINKRY